MARTTRSRAVHSSIIHRTARYVGNHRRMSVSHAVQTLCLGRRRRRSGRLLGSTHLEHFRGREVDHDPCELLRPTHVRATSSSLALERLTCPGVAVARRTADPDIAAATSRPAAAVHPTASPRARRVLTLAARRACGRNSHAAQVPKSLRTDRPRSAGPGAALLRVPSRGGGRRRAAQEARARKARRRVGRLPGEPPHRHDRARGIPRRATTGDPCRRSRYRSCTG